MSENSSKTSSNGDVYDRSLKLFRQELSKLNVQLEKDIEKSLTDVSSQAESYIASLNKKLNR